MATPSLFIGGPLDGQRHEVEPRLNHYKVVTPTHPIPTPKGQLERTACEETIYTRALLSDRQ
jgi:hypothetical protein